MTDDWRAAAKARCEAATEGPWEARDRGYLYAEVNGDPNWCLGKAYNAPNTAAPDSLTGSAIEENAAFIAHARTDLPRALAELDEKDAEIERLQIANLTVVEDLDELRKSRDRLAARVQELEQQLGTEQQAMPVRFPEQSHD